MIAALLGGWLLGPRSRHPSPAPHFDPLSSLDPKSSYLKGVELVRAGRSLAALPYFRRALVMRPDLWQVHCDYAAALLNSELVVAPHRGIPRPISRSSWDRVVGAREAFERFDSAERLAASAADRAYVEHVRATVLGAWGFAWDALRDHRRAVQADPSRPELARALSALLDEMRVR